MQPFSSMQYDSSWFSNSFPHSEPKYNNISIWFAYGHSNNWNPYFQVQQAWFFLRIFFFLNTEDNLLQLDKIM